MDHTSNDPVTNALMGCPPENYILIAYKRGCEDTRQKLQKRIEQLEAEVLAWQKLGNETTQAMSDAVDDCVRATKLAKEKHEQVEIYSALCKKQNETMQKMSAQIDELAELAGIAVKPTRQ